MGVHYSRKLDNIVTRLEKSGPRVDRDGIFRERKEVQRQLGRYYRFPKWFFLIFVILNSAFATWGIIGIQKLPPSSRDQKRAALRLALVLLVFIVSIGCFFLIRYHKVVRLFWVLVILLLQWTLIGGVAAFSLSDDVYEHLLGQKKDKDLIDGAPPPAW